MSGEAYDSLQGAVTAMVDTMTFGHTNWTDTAPLYGHANAHLTGQTVGFYWGAANYVAIGFTGVKAFAAYWYAAPPILVQVSSWADRGVTPDLNSGRWVMLGGPTLVNYYSTGLAGGKFFTSWPIWERSTVSVTNVITRLMFVDDLISPTNAEPYLGYIKWLLGQRIVK